MANPRTLARISARIKERVAYALEFEVADPRASFVTLTRVEVAKDLSTATIFYSVLGSEADRNKTARMLQNACGFFQSKCARVLKTRRLPRIQWVYDESIERAANMDRLIREAKSRDAAIQREGFVDPNAPAEPPDWENEYDEFVEDEEEDERPT